MKCDPPYTKNEEVVLKLFGLLEEKDKKLFLVQATLMQIEENAKKAQKWLAEAMNWKYNSQTTAPESTEPETLSEAEMKLLLHPAKDEEWKKEEWIEYPDYASVTVDGTRNSGDGYIYIAEFGDYLKIGYTISPKNRLATHAQTAKNYGVIKTGRVLLSPAHKDYMKTEKTLHEYFKEYRKDGTELFDVAFECMKAQVRAAIAEITEENA